MRILKLVALTIGIAALGCSGAFADSITSTGTATFTSGTGVGNVLEVLRLNTNTGNESGGVAWNGTTDVTSGDALTGNQSVTITVGQMLTNGVTGNSFVVIFNVNQTGSSDVLTMNTFTVNFYKANGDLLGGVTWNSNPPSQPNQFTADGQGTGSSGYVFLVTLDTNPQWLGTTTNRVGISVPSNSPITGANGGPENFYLGPAASTSTVPEPTTLIFVGSGLLAIVGGSKLRRRKN